MSDVLDLLALGWDQPFPEERAVMYIERLADIPTPELHVAVSWLLDTQDRRPSIAAIRRAVAEARQEFPTDEEAVAQAAAWLDWRSEMRVPLGAGRGRRPAPLVHPAVRAAVESAGLDHLPSFRAAFRAEKERLVLECQAGRMDVHAVVPGRVVALEAGR